MKKIIQNNQFGAGDANYFEPFWDVWDMIDRLYFAYKPKRE